MGVMRLSVRLLQRYAVPLAAALASLVLLELVLGFNLRRCDLPPSPAFSRLLTPSLTCSSSCSGSICAAPRASPARTSRCARPRPPTTTTTPSSRARCERRPASASRAWRSDRDERMREPHTGCTGKYPFDAPCDVLHSRFRLRFRWSGVLYSQCIAVLARGCTVL